MFHFYKLMLVLSKYPLTETTGDCSIRRTSTKSLQKLVGSMLLLLGTVNSFSAFCLYGLDIFHKKNAIDTSWLTSYAI